MNNLYKDLNAKIFVAGHNGMVGSAIVRELKAQGFKNIVTKKHVELDLINQREVEAFFKSENPNVVYLAAAKVGGIHANNTYPADFIYQNLMIQTNVIHQAFVSGVKRLLFLGSSCIYPKFAPQPMREDALLKGELEPTNEPYAIAKIAGIKMIESYNRQYGESHGIDFRSIMPTNLYGPGDNYHPENSHVIPALIQRFHYAKVNHLPEVVIWGSGKARREFLYVDDMARASVYLMYLEKEKVSHVNGSKAFFLNAGFGSDLEITELVDTIQSVVQYQGRIIYDTSKPDGTLKKLMDSSQIMSSGFEPKVDLKTGLLMTYSDYLKKKSGDKVSFIPWDKK